MLDRKALQALLREHEQALFSFLQRLVGDREVAASIFQDAFAAAARRRNPGPIMLYRIALERGREALRLHPRPIERPESEISRNVRKLVGSLPQKLREAFLLHTYQGLSHADVAAILETDEATVRTRIEHAMQHVAAGWDAAVDLLPQWEVGPLPDRLRERTLEAALHRRRGPSRRAVGIGLLLAAALGLVWRSLGPPRVRVMLDIPARLQAGEPAALHVVVSRPGVPLRVLLESPKGPNWEVAAAAADEHGALNGSWVVPDVPAGTYRLRVLADGRAVCEARVDVLRRHRAVLWAASRHWKAGQQPLVAAQVFTPDGPCVEAEGALLLLEDAAGTTLASTRAAFDASGLAATHFKVPSGLATGCYWLHVADTEARLPIAVGTPVAVAPPRPEAAPSLQVDPPLLREGDELQVTLPPGTGLVLLDLLQDDRLVATRALAADAQRVSWRLGSALRGLLLVRASRLSPEGVGRVVGTARVVVRPPAPFTVVASSPQDGKLPLTVTTPDGLPLAATLHLAWRAGRARGAAEADPSFPWSLPGRLGYDLVTGSPLGPDLAALPDSAAPVNLLEAVPDMAQPPPSTEPPLPAAEPWPPPEDGGEVLAWSPPVESTARGEVLLDVPPALHGRSAILDVFVATPRDMNICRINVSRL